MRSQPTQKTINKAHERALRVKRYMEEEHIPKDRRSGMVGGKTSSQKQEESGRASCSAPNCENTYATHRWGKTRAHTDGWFLQKDGSSWCPDHLPDWLAEWRQRARLTHTTHTTTEN